MNPKDQIHYDIAELLEKIAHLNIKLAGTTKIHPVEIDLLRTYINELNKCTDALPVTPLTKSSFSIPELKEEPTTLPSFNTPEETVEPQPVVNETVDEPAAEALVYDEVNEPTATEEETLAETEVAENESAPVQFEEAESGIIEEVEEETGETIVETDNNEEDAIAETESIEETPFIEESKEDVAADPIEVAEEQTPIVEEPEFNAPTEVVEEHTPVAEEPIFAAAPEATEEPAPIKSEVAETQETIEPTVSKEPEQPVAASPDAKRSINDMFTREGKEDLGSRFQFQNRKNLREMIDLSERYVFTKELFAGDADYYDKAIRQLNQYETFAEAEAFMNNELHSKYKWTGKEQVQKQFARIVERRYA